MHKRRQLPLPDERAPISRREKPVPPPPSDGPSGPAPPLPSRPMRLTPKLPKEEWQGLYNITSNQITMPMPIITSNPSQNDSVTFDATYNSSHYGNMPMPVMLPPRNPLEHSESDELSNSFESDQSYEEMNESIPPPIPNRRYLNDDDPPPPPPQRPHDLSVPHHSPHSQRSRSPVNHQRLPPAPRNNQGYFPPPPERNRAAPLPPRPGFRPHPKLESVSSDTGQEMYDDFEDIENYEDQVVYDDGDVGEVYEEADDNNKPPPPPPGRRLPPPPKMVQDTYEVEPEPQMKKLPNLPPTPSDPDCSIYEVEPVVPEFDKPAAPSYPEETYEVTDEPQDTYDEFDVAAPEEEQFDQDAYDEFDVAVKEEEHFDEIQDEYDEFEVGQHTPNDVYEPVEESFAPPPPPPPPSRPKAAAPAPKKQPPPAKNAPPKPKPAPPSNKPVVGGLDLSAITGQRNQLKKVDKAVLKKESSVEEKVYQDENTEFKSIFAKFKQRDAEAAGTKPNLLPKSPGFATKSNVLSPTTKSPISPKPAIAPKKSDPPAQEKRPPPNMKSPSPPPIPNNRPPPPPPVDDNKPPSIRSDSPPPPPPPKIESVPDKPPPHGYSQVNLPKPPDEVTNGDNTGGNDDFDDDEDGDIYDDAMSNLDPLIGEPYYFKDLSRHDGESKLRTVGKDGAFLIRDSSKGGGKQPYTLMVMYKSKMYNLKIRERIDGKYALGEEKADEMAFLDVKAMVDYHRENDVILVHKTGQYKTCLEYFPKN